MENIRVRKERGIRENKEVGLVRGGGVMEYVKNKIRSVKKRKKEFEYEVEVGKEGGGEYRKMKIEFVIVDGFGGRK